MNTRVLFVCIFLALMVSPVSNVLGAVISGTISLPGDDVAPSGGLFITVKAVNLDSDLPGPTVDVTIPDPGEGEPETTYSLNVPTDSNARWVIHYFNNATDNYYELAYYNSTGMTWREDLAEVIYPSEDRPNIDMELLHANTISGTIALPPGADNPPDGILPVTMSAILATDIGVTGGSVPVSITSNLVPTSFEIIVPYDPGVQWNIKYEYSGDLSYFPHGFYSQSGTTEWNVNDVDVTDLNGGDNYPNVTNPEPITLELLNSYTISGTISRQSAPPESLEVQISYEDPNHEGWFGFEKVDIAANELSTSYELSVPPETDAAWRINYFVPANSVYLQKGYYNENELPLTTHWNSSTATVTTLPYSVFSTNPTGIDMTLLTGYSVTGTIDLPGTTAPAGGMDVQVEALYENGPLGYSFWVTIPESGTQSPQYIIPIPDDAAAGWRIRYFYTGSTEYLRSGYYVDATTTRWDFNEAAILYGTQDYPGTTLTLITTPDGDIDGNGSVDLTDVILSLQIITGSQPDTLIHLGADVNGDSRIGLEEAIHSLYEASQ